MGGGYVDVGGGNDVGCAIVVDYCGIGVDVIGGVYYAGGND